MVLHINEKKSPKEALVKVENRKGKLEMTLAGIPVVFAKHLPKHRMMFQVRDGEKK